MPSAPVKSERRKKLRKKPLRLVYVELAFGNGGMMRDLSEEGFAVRAMMPIKQGDKTPFSFTLGEKARIEGEGRVLWIDEGGRVAGVEFTQIPKEMRSQIDDWLIEEEKVADPLDAPSEPKIAPAATLEELRAELRSTPVRGEVAPPASPAEPQLAVEPKPPVEEQPAVTESWHVPEPKAEEPQIAKPPVTAPPAEKLAPQEAAKTAPSSKEDATPKVEFARNTSPQVEGPGAVPPTSSVTEGFFRKWPKEAPPSSAAPDTAAPELPALPELPPPTPASSFARPKKRPIEQEEEGQHIQDRAPLPDISEILIQPLGLTSHPEPRPSALPHALPSQQIHDGGTQWFTLGRALMAMVGVTLLACVIVYHRVVGNGLISLGEAMGGASTHVENAAPPNAGDLQHAPLTNDTREQQPASASNPGPASASNPGPASASNPGPASASNPGPAPSANPAASLGSEGNSPTAPVTPLSSPEATPDSGQSEYLQAIQLMRGRTASHDMTEAVRLLWVAVEKGNPSAEVSLADLYWHGRGVARNCDQARILFTAAARKGSSDAQQRLQQFQQEGCE